MARSLSSPRTSSISFGPGPLSPALKALIGANLVVFVAKWIGVAGSVTNLDFLLGLQPSTVVAQWRVWQLVTYMFVHAGVAHILFNMLALWMFGTELERMWGTRYFLKFYFLTGIGAGALTVALSFAPFGWSEQLRYSTIVGASGAIYGLLLVYGLQFPNRPIYMYMVFPIPAKYFVMIMGALAFFSGDSGVANVTHLGGLLVGYLLLRGARFHPLAEAKYWSLRWKMNRTRKKFDVYSGGRANDWNRRVH